MSLRVHCWEPNLERLSPVESTRSGGTADDVVRQPLRLYDPMDQAEISGVEEGIPSYAETADLRCRQAVLPAAPQDFQVPHLSRLLAAAQWLAHQASSEREHRS